MKAILVVDVPKDFENREPYFVEGSLFCYVKTNYGKYRYVCDLDKTKLKPMPIKVDPGYPCGKYDEGYYDGWDDCIDEILGGEE